MLYTNRRNIIKDKCIICNIDEKLHRHRIRPDGPYSVENTVIVCEFHHIKIHKLMRKDYENGKFYIEQVKNEHQSKTAHSQVS